MFHTILLPSQKGIQIDHMDSPEDVLLHVGIGFLQFFQQSLCLFSLGQALPALGFGLFGKPTGALQKLQLVVSRPGDDVILMDTVHGTNQLHAGIILAVQLGHHSLDLRAVQHPHQCGFHHIAEVMSQRDFVAAQLLGIFV